MVAALVTVCGGKGAAFAAESDRILEHLRAADQARATDATEAQAWAEEKARLELLLTTVEEQTAAARRQARTSQDKLQALDAAAPPDKLEAFDRAAVRVANRIEQFLDTLALRVAPGLVPARGKRVADAREALDQALHRLERTERGVDTVAVSVAPGELDGEPRSVEVLRLGGVAAWWRSLDGQTGGEAQMVDGRLQLHPIGDPDLLDAIGRASAIAKGRLAPEVVLLPIRFARTSTQGDS